MPLLLILAAHATERMEHGFDDASHPWQGGEVQDGALHLDRGSAILDVPDATALTAQLVLRQRDAQALRLRVGDATWAADYTRDGALTLGADVLHFPHGHRSWQTESTPVLEPDPTQTSEAGSVLHCDVHFDDATATWLLYYTGEMRPGYGYRQLHLATSTDGVHWTRHPDNPIVTIDYDKTTVDGIHAHMPSVVVDASGGWHLYYACYENGVGNRICHATSTDGRVWDRPAYGAGRVALDLGDPGAFDDASLREPDVSVAADGTLRMLYVGTRSGEHYGPAGLASSPDGWTWTRVAQLTAAESELQGGTVLQSPYGLEQWYQCNDAFCYAHSPGVDAAGGVDWTTWTLHSTPILTKDWATWNSGYIQAPSAWLVDSRTVHLWFNAYDYGAGVEVLAHARSVPLPDQWVTVDVEWDGSVVRVRFDDGPALEAAVDSVPALVVESGGVAELDAFWLEWEPVAQDTDPVDSEPDPSGDSSVDTHADSAQGSAPSGDPADPSGEPACGCAAPIGRVQFVWVGIALLMLCRRRP